MSSLLLVGCVRDGEWLTSAELEKQQVPHLGYGSQTPPPPDRRKTWHRRRSFPRPAHTGRGGRSRCVREHTKPESLLFAKFNKRAGAENMSVPQFSFRVSRRRKVKRHYLVCWNPLRPPGGADNEVDISHQLIVKHQRIPKSRAGFNG